MNCLKTYPTKCVVYSGKSYPELGIIQGKTTMDEVLGIIVKVLDDVEDSKGESSTTSPATPQVRAAAIPNVRYDTDYSDTGFGYDMQEIMQNLPQGYKVMHKRIALYKNGIPLASSRSTSGILPVKDADLPAQVRVDMTVQAEESTLQYQDSFTLFPNRGTYKRSLSYMDDPQALPDDPEAFRQTVSAELQLIKRELFDKKDTSPTPVSSAELSALREEIQKLKRELAK